MTINERVRHLRKNILHLSQKKFADSLGMTQTGISYLEHNGSSVKEQTITAICFLYNINRDWLYYGKEPIYMYPSTFNLEEFLLSKGATNLEIELVTAYFELDPDFRKVAIDHFKNKLSTAAIFKDSSIYTVPETPEELEKQFPPIISEPKNDIK